MRTLASIIVFMLPALAAAGVIDARPEANEIELYAFDGKAGCGLEGAIEVCRQYALKCGLFADQRFKSKQACAGSISTVGEFLKRIVAESPRCRSRLRGASLSISCSRKKSVLDDSMSIAYENVLAPDIIADLIKRTGAREKKLPESGEILVRMSPSFKPLSFKGVMSARSVLDQVVEQDGGTWVFVLDQAGKKGELSLRNK